MFQWPYQQCMLENFTETKCFVQNGKLSPCKICQNTDQRKPTFWYELAHVYNESFHFLPIRIMQLCNHYIWTSPASHLQGWLQILPWTSRKAKFHDNLPKKLKKTSSRNVQNKCTKNLNKVQVWRMLLEC